MLALFAAILFLDESFAWFNILGAALVLLGIYLMAQTGGRGSIDKFTAKGAALALIAAVLWAGGAIALKLGVVGMDSSIPVGLYNSIKA